MGKQTYKRHLPQLQTYKRHLPQLQTYKRYLPQLQMYKRYLPQFLKYTGLIRVFFKEICTWYIVFVLLVVNMQIYRISTSPLKNR